MSADRRGSRFGVWCGLAAARLGLRAGSRAGHEAALGAGLVIPPAVPTAWAWPWVALGAALVLGALGFFLLRPVEDADLWWHLAYAEDMLAGRTLIPDHSAYSWTPANADHIYCAWLAQFALYGTYRLGGLPLLFALRYAVAGGVLWLIWRHARSLGLARHPITALVLASTVLMSLPALMLKASLFTPLLLTLLLCVWYRLRSGGEHGWRWCYGIPLVMVLWVNTHGGWVCGAYLLALLAAGEALNAVFVPRLALPPRTCRHLWAGLALSTLAVLATPYGVHYPVRLARSLLTLSGEELRTVRDYDPVFALHVAHLPYMLAFAVAAVAVLGSLLLTWRRRGWDWALLLSNLGFAFFYARVVRMTFAWGPVFAMSVLYLLAWLPGWRYPAAPLWRRILAGGAGVAVLGSAGLHGVLLLRAPPICSWIGLGVSYVNPVSEADFIREHLAGCRLGNDYNSGGYLLWRLRPGTPVFIDPRYFPYRSWYRQYRQLEDVQDMAGFLERYPCDVWCINIRLERTVRWFLAAKEWKPVCYGPSAVVFARRGTTYAEGRLARCPDAIGIRNLPQALAVMRFALNVNDVEGACAVADGVRLLMPFPRQRTMRRALQQTAHGLRAFGAGRYALAAHLLSAARQALPGSPTLRTALVESYHRLSAQSWRAGQTQEARAWVLQGLGLHPGNPVLLYNAGVLGWLAAGRPSPPAERPPPKAERLDDPGTGWDTHLRAYLSTRRPHDLARRTDPVAQQLLDGTWTADARPPLILPPANGQSAQR